MKRIHLALFALALATLVLFLFAFGGLDGRPEDTVMVHPRQDALADVAPVASSLELVAALATQQGEREAVPAPSISPATELPCASVQAELEAALVINNEQEQTIVELKAKLAAAIRARDRLTFDVETPYGAFIASHEAEEINDPYSLERIQDWLRQFPVFLGPGEATWIAERTSAKDWTRFGRTSEVALILYLGPDRVMSEVSPARAAELRAYYNDEPIFPR